MSSTLMVEGATWSLVRSAVDRAVEGAAPAAGSPSPVTPR